MKKKNKVSRGARGTFWNSGIQGFAQTKNRQREALEAVFNIVVVIPFHEPFNIKYLHSEAISGSGNDNHRGAKDILFFN